MTRQHADIVSEGTFKLIVEVVLKPSIVFKVKAWEGSVIWTEAASKSSIELKVKAETSFNPQAYYKYVEDLKLGSNTGIGLVRAFELIVEVVLKPSIVFKVKAWGSVQPQAYIEYVED